MTARVFKLIKTGDFAGLDALLSVDPGLVHARQVGVEHPLTALQFAAERGVLDLCRLLVDRGAEVYPNPWNTYPPVAIAAWAGHQAVVDYFLSEIPDKADGTGGLGIAINLAGRLGYDDIVRRHIERDPLAVHQRGWIGDTALHWPCHNNFGNIVSVLVDAGADIEADEIGWTGGKPLHWAAEHAPDATRVLLQAGADVNSRNVMPGIKWTGTTPLIVNATQKDDCAEVAELLLAAGADPNLKDAAGKTALDHALANGLTRVTAVLLGAG